MPAMATLPIHMVRKVTGILSLRPPIRRMSCSPLMAWITEPDAEEEQGLEERVGHQVEDRRPSKRRRPSARNM